MVRFAWMVIAALLMGLALLLVPARGVQDPVPAKVKRPAKAKKGIDAPLTVATDAAVRKGGFRPRGPGVVVAIIEGDEPILVKGYGLANIQKKTRIGPRTTFELASVSKMMTGYAVLILLERGQFALSDPVRKFVPEFPDYGPRHLIRVGNLVHHTSGLPDYTGLENPEHGRRSYVTNEDYGRNFRAMKASFRPKFEPGTQFEYSNTNYMLLGLVIERIAQRSYGHFMEENIFRPLGMTGAWVHERPRMTPKDPELGYVNAVGYSKNDQGQYEASWGAQPDREEVELTTGDGAIWCSAEDMIQWVRGLRAHKLLTPATWRLATTPTRFRDGKVNDYGFGIGLTHNENGVLTGLGHNGSWGGFCTIVDCDLAHDRAIVVLSNRGDIDTDTIANAIRAELTKEAAWRPSTPLSARHKRVRRVPAEPLR